MTCNWRGNESSMNEKKFPALLRRLGGVLLLCVLGVVPLMAHHSPSSIDMNTRYIFKGTVRKLVWQNPHAWVYVDVQKADGSSELWGFETGGPSSLSRAGWSSRTLKAGDKLSIYGCPERNGKRNGFLVKIVLADGRELTPNSGAEELPLPGQSAPAEGPGGFGPSSLASFVEYK